MTSAGLGFEVRVVGGEIALEPMRLDAMLGPDACHGHMRDVASEFCGKLARGPVGRAVGGLVLGRAGEHACLDAISHLVAFPPSMAS